MAFVELDRHEAAGALPAVCMRCGDPATAWREKFFEFPEEEGFRGIGPLKLVSIGPLKLVMEIVAFAQSFGRDGLCLKAPFCERHKRHWFWRRLVIGGGITLWVLAFFSGLFFGHRLGLDSNTVDLVMLGTFVTWAVCAVAAHEISIKHKRIAKDCLALTGVADRFVDALEESRRHARRW